MENIDDLMREKFDSDDSGARFEFREEYWEQAQALIEQGEKEKQRRWLWWFMGVMLAFALALWLLWGHGIAGSLSGNKAGPEGSTTSVTQKGQTAEKQDGMSANAARIEREKVGVTSEQQSRDMESKSAMELEAKQKKQELVSGNVAGKKGLSAPSGANHQFEQKKQKNTAQNQRISTQKGTGTVGIDPKLAPGKSKRQPEIGVDLSNPGGQQNPIGLESPSNTQSTNPPVTQSTNPPVTQSPNQPIHQSTNPPVNQSPNPPVNQSTNPPFIQPINLPSPLSPLELPTPTILLSPVLPKGKAPIAQQPKQAADKPFTFGLTLSAAGYQRSDPSAPWAASIFGGFGNYRINNTWSLMLGAQWRIVPGYPAPQDSINPIKVEQLRYSFGYKQETWVRETRGIHYLEMPVSVRWQKNRFSLEGGAVGGILLAVQNKTILTTESSLEPATTVVKKFVKGNSAAYNKGYVSAFAGAEYRLTDWLALMTRVQYRITPVFKTAIDGKNKGLGNAELGLRVRLY